MKRRVLSVLALLLATPALLGITLQPPSGQPYAVLERSSTHLDEPVLLSVHLTERRPFIPQLGAVAWQKEGRPDLSALEDDFEITPLYAFTKIARLYTFEHTYTYLLLPRRKGRLTVHPIVVNAQTLKPISLRVLDPVMAPEKADESPQPPADEVFVEVSVEPAEPYYQSLMVITTRAYCATSLIDGATSPPESEGIDFSRQGRDRYVAVERNGRQYVAIERKFTGVAKQSGPRAIKGVKFEYSISDDVPLTAVAQDVLINVRPRPDGFPAASNWLPARHLTLKHSWGQDSGNFVIGQPIKRHVTIKAEGVRTDQLPGVSYASSESVSVYEGVQAEFTTAEENGRSYAIRSEEFVLIPKRAGAVTLPSLHLDWWDLDEDALKTAQIPQMEVYVYPDVTRTDTSVAAASDDVTWLSLNAWTAASALLILSWVCRVASRRSMRLRAAFSKCRQPLRRGGNPLAHLRRNVRRACRRDDADDAAACLLRWGRQIWPRSPPENLVDLSRRLPFSELTEELARLDRVLYSSAQESWNGNALDRAFDRHGRRLGRGGKGSGWMERAFRRRRRLEELWPGVSP